MSLFKKSTTAEVYGKQEDSSGGSCVCFVLLDEIAFSSDKLAEDLKKDWNIEILPEDLDTKKNETLVFSIDDITFSVAIMPAPIPNDEAVLNAKTNYMWPDAVKVAENHKAHLIIAILGKDKKVTSTAMVKLASSCLKQKNAIGINTLGTVFSPDFYISNAEGYIKNGDFPLMNLVFFGLYARKADTVCGYTYGMDFFDKDELEILDSSHNANEVMNMLYSIASYVIEGDVVLNDGETIGFSAEQKLPISKSEAVAIDGESLKIGY